MTAEKCPTCGTPCRVESKPYLVPIPGGNGGVVPNGNIDHYEPLAADEITALERAVVEAAMSFVEAEMAYNAEARCPSERVTTAIDRYSRKEHAMNDLRLATVSLLNARTVAKGNTE